jgi:hypothetical protein
MVLAEINRGVLWLLIVAGVMLIIIYSTRRENRKESRRKQSASFAPDSSVQEEESRDVALSFAPRHAAEYRDQEHMPNEAQIWEHDEWSLPHRARPDGFTPEEARLWRDAGYTAREARRLSQEHEAPPPRSA